MEEQRLVITGAARGIGRATAELAIAAGARVLLVDRDPIEDLPPADPGRIVARQFDLADPGAIESLARDAQAEFETITAILHIAGVVVRAASIDDVTEEDFDRQCAVNLRSAFFLVARLRRLIVNGGAIVLFSSQAAWTGGLGGSLPYAATKAGILALTRGFARELAPDHIRVNAVVPGFVDTGMMRDGLTEDRRQELLRTVPLGRMADPVEIARATLMLIGPDSSYMTGAALDLTGGLAMR